jgi:hypothetical protein
MNFFRVPLNFLVVVVLRKVRIGQSLLSVGEAVVANSLSLNQQQQHQLGGRLLQPDRVRRLCRLAHHSACACQDLWQVHCRYASPPIPLLFLSNHDSSLTLACPWKVLIALAPLRLHYTGEESKRKGSDLELSTINAGTALSLCLSLFLSHTNTLQTSAWVISRPDPLCVCVRVWRSG